MRGERPPGSDSEATRDPPRGYRVRVLVPSDQLAWVELRGQLWPDHSREELVRDAEGLLRSEHQGTLWRAGMPATVFVAELSSGRIVGFVEADLRPFADHCHTSPVGYLEGWYVLPEHRGKGVGGALVRQAEAWAVDRGCTEMASDAYPENRLSRAAHAALGYEEVAPLIHFRRDLKKSPG